MAPIIGLLTMPLLVVGMGVADVIPSDTCETKTVMLDAVVVVAERNPIPLRQTVSATHVLTSQDLRKAAVRRLADALNLVPGLLFIDKDGSGNSPIGVSRGFFGGGETDYILLHLDGVPVNDLWSGLADWSQIPVSAIDRIEVSRGQGSAEYGDAAIAATVDVITKTSAFVPEVGGSLRWSKAQGRGADLSFRVPLGRHQFSLLSLVQRGDGFRSHAGWDEVSLFVNDQTVLESVGSLRLFGRIRQKSIENPGPLDVTAATADRRAANPAFARDERDRDQYEAGATIEAGDLGSLYRCFDVRASILRQKGIETLALTPQFSDSQRKEERGDLLWGSFRIGNRRRNVSLLFGTDLEIGQYTCAYSSATDPSLRLSLSEGTRLKSGTYLESRIAFVPRLQVVGGLRYDWMRPTNTGSLASQERKATFGRLSPRLGMNLAYLTSRRCKGNFYFNWSTAFKAPSLAQLYDQRQIWYGPDLAVSFANSELRPQQSRGFELGFYQQAATSDGLFGGEVTATIYLMKMRDEIDFDLATLRYQNILSSEHSGIEGSARIVLGERLQLSGGIAVTKESFAAGENRGKRLKNIPKYSAQIALMVKPTEQFDLYVGQRLVGTSFLDDQNETTLEGFQLVDCRLQMHRGIMSASVFVLNMFNERYSSTGYVLFDPASLADVSFVYPAAERQIGLEFGFILK